jgi:hypothetical protein
LIVYSHKSYFEKGGALRKSPQPPFTKGGILFTDNPLLIS